MHHGAFGENGGTLTLTERPHPEWTVRRVNELRYGQDDDAEAMLRLADTCDALGDGWRERMRKQAHELLPALDLSGDDRLRLIDPRERRDE